MKWFELMSSKQPISVASIMQHTISPNIDISNMQAVSGCDERYFPANIHPGLKAKEEMDMHIKFPYQLYQWNCLQQLEYPHLSVIEKMDIVKQLELFVYSKPNIAAGGLMTDFDYDF